MIHTINELSNSTQKEKNNTDNGNSGAAPVSSGSNPDGVVNPREAAPGSSGGDDTALNPAERSLLQKVQTVTDVITMRRRCIHIFHI